MTLHQPIGGDRVDGVAVGAAPECLHAIESADCAAAIWQRTPLPVFQEWVDALTPDTLPRARLILRPSDAGDAMTDLFDSYALPHCDKRSTLVDDVAALAQLFGNVMQTPFIRLRLDVINTNACRKFHTDVITARLLCTYRGTGTQYGVSLRGKDPDRVFTAATGSPIILRGKLWPAPAAPDLVHRSPPIQGTGETRLVLVLDPVKDLAQAEGEELLH